LPSSCKTSQLLYFIYSTLQLNEVQNQGFTNQIILLPPASSIAASCLKTSDFVTHAKENCCNLSSLNSCSTTIFFYWTVIIFSIEMHLLDFR
jgi:hypothetical protein